MPRILLPVVLLSVLTAAATAQQLERFMIANPLPPTPPFSQEFGHKVYVSGEWCAISDPLALFYSAGTVNGYLGHLHMYQRTAEGWVLRQSIEPPLLPPDNVLFNPIGQAVAIDGDTMAIGSLRDDANGGKGTVWIYTCTGERWSLTERLDPLPPVSASVFFGHGLSLMGDHLYISRLGEGPIVDPFFPNHTPGQIEHYVRGNTGWRRLEVIRPEAMQPLPKVCAGMFATDGDVMGMVCADLVGFDPWNTRYLRIYERLGGAWSEVAIMPAVVYPGNNAAQFGISIAVYGDWIAVGCPLPSWDMFSPPLVPGQVYLYRRTAPGVWALHQRLEASNGWFGVVNGLEMTDEFGRSLAFASDGRLIVGAENAKNSAGERFRGAAYVFEFDGVEWVERQRFTSALAESNSPNRTELGKSVAIDRKTIVAGAPLFLLDPAVPFYSMGAAYIFEDLAPIGQTTCTGVPGPFGQVARLGAVGSTRAHVGVVEFEGLDLPPFTTALLVGGSQGAFVPNPGGSAGNLCLSGAVRLTTGFGPTDLVGRWQGVVELPSVGAPGAFQVTAGSTWHVQLWFRQAGSPPTSNFSGGLALSFD